MSAEKQRRHRAEAPSPSAGGRAKKRVGARAAAKTGNGAGARATLRTAGREPAPETRLIRKYGNRRLYDTRTSRYVTLGDLLEVFSGEEEVQVIDAVSGDDLTKQVLAQAILLEEGRRNTQIVPTGLLRTLLKQRGSMSREAWERKMNRLIAEAESPPGPAPLASRKPPAAEPPPGELDDLKRRLRALESQVGRGRRA